MNLLTVATLCKTVFVHPPISRGENRREQTVNKIFAKIDQEN